MRKRGQGQLDFIVAGIVILWALAGVAQGPPLTTVAAIHALTNAQASQGLPVRFEATVTCCKKGDMDLFLQDGGTAVYAENAQKHKCLGWRSRAGGRMHQGEPDTEIKAESVTVSGRAALPAAVPASFKQLVHGELDTRESPRGRWFGG